MANQQEINDLLNDSWDQESQSKSKITSKQKTVIKQAKPVVPQSNYQQSYSYANQDFQDYQQSKRTQSIQQSYSDSLPPKQNNKNKQKQKQKSKQLASIKQQPSGVKKPQISKASQNYIKPALQLQPERKFNKKKVNQIAPDKVYLPHNYARLQERQKQLLLTTLAEQNKKLKAQLSEQVRSLEKFQAKYNILLQEKTQNNSTAKQIALQKQVVNLKTRLQQMANLQKITEQRQKFKTKLGKNPGNFIPEEQSNRRQSQLLELIEKLKRRLLQSDQNMGVLQKKLNQGVQYNDQLHRKIKRVEQLEYKIEKMVEQAETDRGYINILKQKIKQLEKQIEQQKNKYRKLQIQMKRLQMSQLTHADILKELEQVKKQKQLLEKSLKDISSAMMTNVRKNYQNISKNKIEDSDQLLRANK